MSQALILSCILIGKIHSRSSQENVLGTWFLIFLDSIVLSISSINKRGPSISKVTGMEHHVQEYLSLVHALKNRKNGGANLERGTNAYKESF